MLIWQSRWHLTWRHCTICPWVFLSVSGFPFIIFTGTVSWFQLTIGVHFRVSWSFFLRQRDGWWWRWGGWAVGVSMIIYLVISLRVICYSWYLHIYLEIDIVLVDFGVIRFRCPFIELTDEWTIGWGFVRVAIRLIWFWFCLICFPQWCFPPGTCFPQWTSLSRWFPSHSRRWISPFIIFSFIIWWLCRSVTVVWVTVLCCFVFEVSPLYWYFRDWVVLVVGSRVV